MLEPLPKLKADKYVLQVKRHTTMRTCTVEIPQGYLLPTRTSTEWSLPTDIISIDRIGASIINKDPFQAIMQERSIKPSHSIIN